MERHCEGLILSKKGFGEGHLLLNFLDSEKGKIRVVAYGAALETGLRRATTLSGSIIEGLIQQTPKTQGERLTDTKLISSLEYVRDDLKPMGFLLYLLEFLDHFILEGDLFSLYEELKETLFLFDETLDEKYILFFLGKFLGQESWLEISEKQNLKPQTLRFLNDSYYQPIGFLKGKNISTPRKQELAYFYMYAFQYAKGKPPHSLELLRFDTI